MCPSRKPIEAQPPGSLRRIGDELVTYLDQPGAGTPP